LPAACLRQLSIFFSCQFFAFFLAVSRSPVQPRCERCAWSRWSSWRARPLHSRVCNLAIAGGNAGLSSGWALNRETPLHLTGILWASLDPRVLVEVVLF
jgi:hypothetical protein